MSLPQGVTVFCDPTLAPAMRAVAATGGPPIAILSAPAALMLAQITRHTRNDVLFTLSTAMDQAVQLNLVKPETRLDGFANTLVLAARAGRATPAPANAVIAVTDATPASGLDGRKILAANAIMPRRILGAANTADAAYLLTTGAADLSLVYLTDVKADPRLIVFATLSGPPALTSCAAAVNANAVSPDARTFVNLLRHPDAEATLRAAGLVTPA